MVFSVEILYLDCSLNFSMLWSNEIFLSKITLLIHIEVLIDTLALYKLFEIHGMFAHGFVYIYFFMLFGYIVAVAVSTDQKYKDEEGWFTQL